MGTATHRATNGATTTDGDAIIASCVHFDVAGVARG